MADIAAGDVTYSLRDQKIDGGKGDRENLVEVSFGDAVDTYPAGGIPLTKANMGMPNELKELHLVDPSSGDGFVYKYDEDAESIRIYQEADSAGALAEFSGGSTVVAATTLLVKAIGY